MIRFSILLAVSILLASVAAASEGAQHKYPVFGGPLPNSQPPAAITAEFTDDDAIAEIFADGPVDLPAAVATESVVPANEAAAEKSTSNYATRLIALIIDDLGNQRIAGERTVALQGPVACAIMPHTSHATYLAEQAYAAGKEVILHLPMQPVQMDRIAGPGEISLDTARRDLSRILQFDLDSVPHTVGVNNHMGSLITRHPGHMRWLMEELRQRGDLFFIDSYTTPSSVAYDIAVEKGVPAARRHVFLDNEPTTEQVAKQFRQLQRQAERQGYAIGIGHPYPVTLTFLEEVLPTLDEQGFQLVPVSTIVDLHQDQLFPDADPAVSDAKQAARSVF